MTEGVSLGAFEPAGCYGKFNQTFLQMATAKE